jgi:hypothetical protein
VLSDGDGNPRQFYDGSGRGYVNATSGTSGTISQFSVNVDNSNSSGIIYGLNATVTGTTYPGVANSAAIYANNKAFGQKYGVYATVSTVGYGSSSAGYFVNAGSASDDGHGVYAENTQTDTNGGGIAYAVYANAKTTVGAANSGYSVGVFSQTANYLKNINFWAKSLYTGSSAQTVLLVTRNGSDIGSISTTTTTTSYNITSDQRLKENIQDSDSASSLIDALQVRQYDWKSNGSHQRYGFVAQELVTVAPEAVYQPEDTEQMMAVDYSKLVPMLVKEIQSLRKRLADAGI